MVRTLIMATRRCRATLHLLLLGFIGLLLLGRPGASSYAQAPVASGSPWPPVSSVLQPLPPVSPGPKPVAADGVVQMPDVRTGVVPVSHEEVQSQPSPKGSSPPRVAIVRASSVQPAIESIPPGVAAPNPAGSLTLADLENMALANNPTLVQATTRIQAAQGRRLQGGLRPNPIVGYQASEVGNEGRVGQQGAFYSQEFVRGGKLALNRAVGTREVAQALQELAAQRLRVLNDVRIEYFNVLVAQRAMELARELTDLGRRGVETTERLFQGQQVGQAEVLQARIESASATITLQNAQNRRAAAWQRLSSVIGVPGMALQTLSGDLTPPLAELDWEESYTRVVAQSPELASARAGVLRARAILERAQAEPIPNVDVQLGVQYDNASQYTIGNVQLGVPIPFRNRNQGNIQTAFADVRNAEANIGRIELSLRNRLALAFERYANARNQVDTFTRQILPDARSSLELVSTAYRQGQVNFLALLTAQRTYSQANLAYLQAVQELNASRVAIEGLLLTGSLQDEPGPIDMPVPTEGIAPVFGPGRPPVERN